VSGVAAWIRASRLPSQSYIFLPLLLGQALLVREGGTLSWATFALVHLFGLFDQLYIVYANDVADRHSDPLNTTATIFSGGSRVLVEGQLQSEQLVQAAGVMAALCLVTGAALWGFFGRWLCLPLSGLALVLLWLYSFGPVRLSYRGGGELLQMVGVGGVLPLFGYHAQAGGWTGFPWELLWVLLPTHLASALATALNLGALAALVRVGGYRPWGRRLLALLALPLFANLAQLPLCRNRPGSLGLTLQVGLAVLVTLSLVGGLAMESFWSEGAV